MKSIAFVFPDLLPMPPVKGGATETLIQQLIDDNEKAKEVEFYIYSRYDAKAQAWAEKYKRSHFVYLKEDNSLCGKLKYLLFRLRRKLSKAYVPEPYLKSLTQQIKKAQHDCVIVESAYRFIPYIKKKTKKKVLLHLHFDAAAQNNTYLETALGCCDGVICVSHFIEKKIRGVMQGVPTCVLPNVVDTELFDREKHRERAQRIREDLGIQSGDKVVLYCGRIMQVKGVLELVKAFQSAVMQEPRLRLVLVGSAEYGQTTYDAYHQQLIQQIGSDLNHRIFMTGYVDHCDMPPYYAMADVAVLPTTLVEEAAPLTVLEALASGCYFIGSDSGGIPEHAACSYAKIVKRADTFEEDLAKALSCATGEATEGTPVVGRTHVCTHHDARKYYKNFVNCMQENV